MNFGIVDLQAKAAKEVIKKQLTAGSSSLPIANSSSNNNAINWNDFNYPPGLKLFHFTLNELEDPEFTIIRRMFYTHLLTAFISFINVISSITRAATGFGGMLVLYSLLQLIILNAFSTFTFYLGIQAIARDQKQLKKYKVCQITLVIAYLLFAFMFIGAFNGFFAVKNGGGFAGFLGILESLGYLLNAVIAMVCVLKAHFYA